MRLVGGDLAKGFRVRVGAEADGEDPHVGAAQLVDDARQLGFERIRAVPDRGVPAVGHEHDHPPGARTGVGPGDGDAILVQQGAPPPVFLPFAKTPVANPAGRCAGRPPG